MSTISSIGSTSTSAYTNPLDKNGDGVVDAQELQEAAQSGLLQASLLSDESDSGSSASDAFSGNLASMLLDMQQSGQSTGSSDSTAGSSDPMDTLFDALDSDGDGKITSAEFVANRPQDMSEEDATNLFDSLDTSHSGSIDKGQLAKGLHVLSSQDSSAAEFLSQADSLSAGSSDASGDDASSSSSQSDPATTAQQQAFAAYLAALQQSSDDVYRNTYGQYDDTTVDAVSA